MSHSICRPVQRRMQPVAGGLVVRAPAKINLDLLVGPLGEDGYHPLDSIVSQVTLYDVITMTSRSDGRMVLTVEGLDCGPSERNLALRAARLMAEGRDVCGVDILLEKSIPPGSGLGGGSSDAAAVLVGCNELWNLGVSFAEMSELAGRLGSDVPLFLGGSGCRIRGRGERVESADVYPACVLVVVPPVHCSTGAVYSAFDAAGATGLGDRRVDGRYALPPSRWRDGLVNDLALAARAVSAELAWWWDRLSSRLPVRVQLTGSGSGLFCLCDDEVELEACWDALDTEARTRAWAVRMIGGEVPLGR